MGRIAFITIGAIGHVYNCLAIARELVDRGDDVYFLTPAIRAGCLQACGATHVPISSVLSSSGASRAMDGFRIPDVPLTLARETVATLPEILVRLERMQPDVVVYDSYTFAGQLAAEILRLPAVRKNGSFALRPWCNYFADTESGVLPGRLTSPESLAGFDDRMRPLFERYGLPVRSFHEWITSEPELELVFLSRAFQPQADRYGENTLFLGPVVSDRSRPDGSGDAETDRGEWPHLVYISLGSVFSHQPAFFYHCIEAFEDLEARVVMAVGRTFPDDFWVSLPRNIVVRPFVSQLHLLRQADLFITHAGAGSVMEAIHHGVPMLAVPQFPEQWVLGSRMHELGCGLLLPREEVCIAALRRDVHRLLAEPAFRTQARALGEAAARDGGYRRACDAIQRFAQNRRADRGSGPLPNPSVPDGAEHRQQAG